MADGFWMLLFLSMVIASTSIAAGFLPLALSLSRKRVQAISSIGMGLLVGTSLIVIIPEGVSTLYSSYGPEGSHMGAPGALLPPDTDGIAPRDGASKTPPAHEDHHHSSPENLIGTSLILGFVFMYLIHIFSTWSTRTVVRPSPTVSIMQLRAYPSSDTAEEVPQPPKTTFSATLGLLIHAVADGIALGASSGASKTSLSFIVFFAIMLHKAPAAFGLVALLLNNGLSRRQARAHLIAFSFAAPVGAFGTWLIINILGRNVGNTSEQNQNTEWWTGILLLFSAGTFLFVAMHAMQESLNSETHEGGDISGFHSHEEAGRMLDIEMTQEGSRPGSQNTLLTVLGMLLPLITHLGPAHAH